MAPCQRQSDAGKRAHTVKIAGLVVYEHSRRTGLGLALMQDAEAWAAHHGLKSV